MRGDSILLERGAISTITLNRPEIGNQVDDPTLDTLAEQLRELSQDDSCRVLVFRGAGEKFCAGRDPRGSHGGPELTAHARRRSIAKIVAVNELLGAIGAVTIAAVHGEALGFGCGLAVQCDFTLATEEASFGFPEINGGFPPTIVMSYLHRYVPRKVATELVLTGRRVAAREAATLGLANKVVGRDELEPELSRLIETLRAKNPGALRAAKRFMHDVEDLSVEQASRYGVHVLSVELTGP
jgi:enoyl-CoA hydratase/carnithine racemase